MSNMKTLGGLLSYAISAGEGWDVPGIAYACAAPIRYGRKPTGAAAAKRAKTRRRNIAKRLTK